MTEPGSAIFRNLIALGKVDGGLARILAERNKLKTALESKEKELAAVATELTLRQRQTLDRRNKYSREEKALRDENQKLIDRRKALSTLGAFKLQQAAEREIDVAAKQLESHEENMLVMLEELDKFEASQKEYEAKAGKLKEELAVLNADMAGTMANLAEREGDYQKQRQELRGQIKPEHLKIYDVVAHKSFMDPMAKILRESCTCALCNVKLGPQILVQVNRAESLVKCPGCGRIMYLEEGD